MFFLNVLTDINYFHCFCIVEILKETEADTKNVFGRYGSQRMRDWLEIMKVYEKDNLYLAEAAHLLISNVKYEIPNMKKRIAKCLQNQQVRNNKVICTLKKGIFTHSVPFCDRSKINYLNISSLTLYSVHYFLFPYLSLIS